MSQPSTIRLERTTPRTAKITFANPPANLVIPETVVTLHEIARGLDNDPDIQVVVFASEVPGFFFNHFDGAEAGNLPAPEHEDDAPVWTDLVLRLSKASRPSGAAPAAPATSWPSPVTCGTPAGRRRSSASPRSVSASSPAAAVPSGSRGPSAATGHSRRSSAAPTTTPTWPSAGDGSPGPCPTRTSTLSSTRRSAASLPSTGRRWRPPRRWSAGPPCRQTPT
jgi:hypothetical protein